MTIESKTNLLAPAPVRVKRNHEWTECSHAEPAAFTVATFVPALADIPSVSLTRTGFGIRKLLIGMIRAKDLRIRNAWVRGSNPLCALDRSGSHHAAPPMLRVIEIV